MSATDWRKAGRDAAHEDATHDGAAPCTTLDDARVRCAAWLEDAEGADVEAAAAGYLAGWAAHLRDTTAQLDLDAIEARNPNCCNVCRRPALSACDTCGVVTCDGCACGCDAPRPLPLADDVTDLLGEVRRLRALRVLLGDVVQAYDDLVAKAWRTATDKEYEAPASVEDLLVTMRTMRATARREGAEAMREACVEAVEFGMPINNHKAEPVRDALAAIRALPLPEETPR